MEDASGQISARWPWLRVQYLVFAAALFVFLPSITTGFVFDDVPLIVQNEFAHSLRWVGRAFTTHLWDVSRVVDSDAVRGTAEASRRYYRPLVAVSYLLTWVVAGARPWVYHLTNVVLHGVTAALATRAALRWTGSAVLALALGLIFAIHPTRTENVIWISGRTDTLMFLFLLLSLEGFRLWAERGRPAALLGATGALVASVLSKEPAAMLPLLLLAERALPTSGRTADYRKREKLGLLLATSLCVAYGAGRVLFWSPEGAEVHRLLTPEHFLVTVGLYTQRTLVPWPPTMYYYALEYAADGRPLYSSGLLALGAVVVAAFLAALVWSWRRARSSFWLLVATAAFMGPLLNLYFTGMTVSAQDRFLYVSVFLGAGATTLLARERVQTALTHRMGKVAAAGVALIAVSLVWIRTPDYRNERSFWDNELAHNPAHPYALRMRARIAAREGKLEEADRDYAAANASSPRYQIASGALLRAASHFEHAFIVASLLPDGRVDELRALLDELWRLVDIAWVPPRRQLLGIDLGTPIDPRYLRRLADARARQWDVALLATRLGDYDRAAKAVETTTLERLLTAPSPLNGALALARMGRNDEARRLQALMLDHGSELGTLVTDADTTSFARRFERASALARQRDAIPAVEGAKRSVYEALRLAELGAYLAALRSLERGNALEISEVAPLVTQLLVACRLEDAAAAVAARPDGNIEQARVSVESLARELPPPLRRIAPLPGDLRTTLERAARPFPTPESARTP